MRLYNTLNRQTDELQPQQPPQVSIYTCGPTVYDYPHIGNWFTFVRYDILVRTLKLAGYQPQWVMNITDVGHLTSDADEGEDKLEKGARREGKTAWDVAKYYGDYFNAGLERLNITAPAHLPKATEHIQEQIGLVKTLEQQGYTYIIDDGVYFDTAKFPEYAAFAQLDLDEQQAGKRVEFNRQKRNVSDFALWKFSPADGQRDMEWDSPWAPPGEPARKGFPGWHLECSAMAMKYLGRTVDIHSGGIDHVPVHHTNEIAQSQAANGQPLARYWMHTNHITVEGQKISKSLGNGITLEDVEAHGYSLEVLRLHILESHYRSQSKFSWETLEAAKNRLGSYRAMAALAYQPQAAVPGLPDGKLEVARHAIAGHLLDDLNTPLALAGLSRLADDLLGKAINATDAVKLKAFVADIDAMLGLKLGAITDISALQKQLIADRQAARSAKDWQLSDQLRQQLQSQGIGLRDMPQGAIWYWI